MPIKISKPLVKNDKNGRISEIGVVIKRYSKANTATGTTIQFEISETSGNVLNKYIWTNTSQDWTLRVSERDSEKLL